MDFTGVKYEGEEDSGRFHGEGAFTFATGTKYVGSFKDGMFHGKGTMHLATGGKYTATWDHGREVEGSYEFKDGLKYDVQHGGEWKYCTAKDRRFHVEYEGGIKPAGESVFQNSTEKGELPVGCFDVGDGYIDPSRDSSVRKFSNGRILRPTQPGEAEWAKKTCRVGT